MKKLFFVLLSGLCIANQAAAREVGTHYRTDAVTEIIDRLTRSADISHNPAFLMVLYEIHNLVVAAKTDGKEFVIRGLVMNPLKECIKTGVSADSVDKAERAMRSAEATVR